ncbi:hypothetical protein GQ53DRAFT_363223 [Thozetella sp. PMI_491]|nr:hypothetical protein GQ53DRAFT_363223 [Thozetella sp. PMI_491]
MARKLLNWFHEKRAKLNGKGNAQSPADSAPPPIVPAWTQRSRPLTPSSSDPDLVAATAAATAGSAFFQRLPPEIRRKVLVVAFGGRALHMSLEFGHPRQLIRTFDGNQWQTTRYMNPGEKWSPQELHPDPGESQAWQWRGCRCMNQLQMTGVYHQGCIPGMARCWQHEADVPWYHQIGAMGWLLACRQAYMEGIEVLYGANAIRISNTRSVMSHHLETLLSPIRRSMITSIELGWNIRDLTGPGDASVHAMGRPEFLALLEAVPKALPNLRTIYMDIYGRLFPGLRLEERPPLYDKSLFNSIDDMVRKLPERFQELTISVPFTVFQKRLARAGKEGAKIERIGFTTRFWRPLPAVDNQSQVAAPSAGGGHGIEGYWVIEGDFDDPYPLMGCFGSGSTDPARHDAINKELHSYP